MSTLFPQTVIAMMWDFDKTLSPSYMQDPLFKRFRIKPQSFWDEVNDTVRRYDGSEINVSTDAVILNQIVRYVEAGKFKNLSNKMLKDLGSKIELYDGLPDFFKVAKDFVQSKNEYKIYGISVEHYIVSTGLRQMVLGSKIAPFVDGVWGCEYIDKKTSGKLCVSEIAYLLDHTTKTKAVFEINKGSNKHPIDVNANIDFKERRVPFENMIYVADGPSDIPTFSIINRFHGRTYGVYPPGSTPDFKQCKKLLDDRRVQAFGEANYSKGTATYMWLLTSIEEIAERIVLEKKAKLESKVSAPPHHITNITHVA